MVHSPPSRVLFLMGGYALAVSVSLGRESRLRDMCFSLQWLETVPQPYLEWGKLGVSTFPGATRKKYAWVAFVLSTLKSFT